MKDNNKGKEGLDSLRINGSKIDNLPLGQGEKAKDHHSYAGARA